MKIKKKKALTSLCADIRSSVTFEINQQDSGCPNPQLLLMQYLIFESISEQIRESS